MKQVVAKFKSTGSKRIKNNPATIEVFVHVPCNSGGYSNFYVELNYDRSIGEWFFNEMSNVVDIDVVEKFLFNREPIFSKKIQNLINRKWATKNFWTNWRINSYD